MPTSTQVDVLIRPQAHHSTNIADDVNHKEPYAFIVTDISLYSSRFHLHREYHIKHIYAVECPMMRIIVVAELGMYLLLYHI